jgi:uncharacterized membrane protein YGL010W
MKTLDAWLLAYSKDHQNSLNKKIHYICVPLIFWSLLGLMYLIPTLSILNDYSWNYFFYMIALLFYYSLNKKVFIFMYILFFLCHFSYIFFPYPEKFLIIASAIFGLAWAGQFYGHFVEGRKPSFLDDLLYLFIGPIWVFLPIMKLLKLDPYKNKF